jgi:hypothetical protein
MPGHQSQSSARQVKADKEAELRRRRTEQLETIRAAAEGLRDAVRSARDKSEQGETLANHLSGFYEEVDKLAKGKALLEATDLTVEHVNHIVRDAKVLIEGDAYLDRIKEFVPAGNNPLYPDVLLTTRAVQQAVSRFQSRLVSRRQDLILRLREAETIVRALQLFLDNDGHIATKEDVATMIDHPAAEWFRGAYASSEFDFLRLDNRDMVAYLSADLTISDGGSDSSDGQQ